MHDQARVVALRELGRFCHEFDVSLTARADALFELTDAVLCADAPVRSLVELTFVAEYRRGHGAMYDALGRRDVEPERVRRTLASLLLPPLNDRGRIALAVDVLPWLRSDGPHQRGTTVLSCLRSRVGPGPADSGWPYSLVTALEPGRTSWTALLEAVRLGPADDAIP